MGWAVAVAQVGLKAFGIAANSKAQAAQAEALATGSYRQMNYAFQNYEIERQDAFDAAVNEITKTRINQMQLNSQVKAAVAEGYMGGGRTANRILRATEADTSRTVASIQDNYARKSNEIDLNKNATLLSTNDYLASVKEQYKPNKWGDILDLMATGLSAYDKYRTERTATEAAGGTWDSKKGPVMPKSASSALTLSLDEIGNNLNNDIYGWDSPMRTSGLYEVPFGDSAIWSYGSKKRTSWRGLGV